ncbi:Alpha/Beta hydrolase protein [Ephemerocybe angulata]|uniref:Alpha/Beta hydrolase protein n=1 Tax=Ephemerocybe angulata TaxID=980116 RepID=A0A8H6M4Q5_9AGAR|nr:Alpha/Beta hydrolase protein [Tulosesus angulatus]
MAGVVNATLALTEKFVSSSDGTQIFAQAVGNSRLPALVFVHGFAVSALVWANIFRDTNLLRYFYLVAYDLRGHGRSGKPGMPEEYSTKLLADDFVAVTRAFGVEKPLYVGWSLGGTHRPNPKSAARSLTSLMHFHDTGSFASDVLEHYGVDALAGIVYTTAVPYLAASPKVLTSYVQNTVIPGLTDLTNSSLALSTRIDMTTNLFSHPEKAPAEVLWSWLGSSALLEPAKATLISGPGRVQDTANLFKAGQGGLPVLVVNGDEDRYVVGEEVVRALEGFKGLEVHSVRGGSHALFWERQVVFVGVVGEFARRVFKRRVG